MNLKKILALSLSVAIIASNSFGFAEIDSHKISANSPKSDLEVLKPNDGMYLSIRGKIIKINKTGSNVSILVENEFKDGVQKIVFHIDENVKLYSTKTMDKIKVDELKEAAIVSVSFNVNTPMALSEPPQMTPNVIILEDSETSIFTVVEKFDDKLITLDGNYIIQPDDKTVIVKSDGTKGTINDIKGAEAVVFTGIVTKSLPGQTTPFKVVIIKEKPEFEMTLEETDLKVINNVNMVPLRKVAEGLGFEVKWNPENKTVEIIKGVNWNLVSIGKNQYNFAKMNIELEAAPVIVNERTFVPQEYISQILMAEMEIVPGGLLITK